MIAPAWEPLLVTTLRRYQRRGAPPSLLQRLAGGRRDWRLLNEFWCLDGRYVRPEPIKRLSAADPDDLVAS